MTEANEKIRSQVRTRYGEIAAAASAKGCGCAPDCCSDSSTGLTGTAYDGVAGHVAEADLGLGCGLPVEHARISPGESVLDLGSGAGNDVFIARHETGPSGRVIGVDMTPEMITAARTNADKLGFANVEFRLGEIEHLPVEQGSIDLVISNCVLNLVPDKRAAFAEMHRVLKPGGRFCISDIVSSGPLPAWTLEVAALYTGCVAGAIPQADYLTLIAEAGFGNIEVVRQRRIELPEEVLARYADKSQLAEAAADDLHVLSITVTGTK